MKSRVNLIEFLAVLPTDEVVKTSFKTGLGPCDKTVYWLHYEFTETTMSIYQSCTDGSQQIFVYKMSDIKGRIKIERNL